MKNRKEILRFSCLLVFILTYCSLCAWMQQIAVVYGLVFLFYLAFGILSIGHTFLHLLNIPTENWIEKFGISFALGYALNIICYLVSFPFFGILGLRIIWGVMVIASLGYNIYTWKNEGISLAKSRDSVFVLIIIGIVLGFQLFAFAANNFSTSFTGVNSYYCDLFYWASDAVTFTKQFPPINFRHMNGNIYYYHYFSSIQVAVASLVTGIPIYNYVFGFSFIQSAILLVFSSYILIHRLVKNRLFMATGIIISLFSSGLDYYSWVTYTSHMYIAPFGFDIGMSFGMLTLFFILRQEECPKIQKNIFIPLFICFIICMGCKSPVACIVLVILGLECLYLLLYTRKKNKVTTALFYGCILLMLFLIMFIFVVNGVQDNSKLEQFVTEETNNTILRQPRVAAVHDSLLEQFGNTVGQVIFIVYYLLIVNPAVFLCFLIGTFFAFFIHTKYEHEDVIIFSAVIIGILLTRGMKMIGFSQIYFIMAATPYAAIVGIRGIEKGYNELCRHARIEKKPIYRILCFALMGIGGFYFINSMYFIPQFTSGVRKVLTTMDIYTEEDIYLVGYTGRVKCEVISEESRQDFHYIVIENEEMEACQWIRENTNSDCMIVSNLIETTNYQFNYPIGVISERWIWMLDEDVIRRALCGEAEGIERLLEEKVQYLITNNDDSVKWDESSVAFENDKVIIIDLQKL